jgi:hypothetical protein
MINNAQYDKQNNVDEILWISLVIYLTLGFNFYSIFYNISDNSTDSKYSTIIGKARNFANNNF